MDQANEVVPAVGAGGPVVEVKLMELRRGQRDVLLDAVSEPQALAIELIMQGRTAMAKNISPARNTSPPLAHGDVF